MQNITKHFSRIVQIRIRGSLSQRMSKSIYQGLTHATYLPTKAIIININSHGGSLTQAKNVCDMLTNFRKQKNIQMYCFVEELCVGPANLVLMAADRCYANRMSMLGGFGFDWTNMNFRAWKQKYQVGTEEVTANELATKYRFFEQMTPEAASFTSQQVNELSRQLKKSVLQSRSRQISQKKSNIANIEQQIQRQIFSKLVSSPETMIKYGLIDGIKNSWEIIEQKYPKSKIFMINQPTRLQGFAHRIQTLKLQGLDF